MADPKQPNGTPGRNGLTYKDAGVDIDAGEALVGRIAPAAKATRRPGADAALGGFGGLFDLKAAGFRDPILVSGTDGVGNYGRHRDSLAYERRPSADVPRYRAAECHKRGRDPHNLDVRAAARTNDARVLLQDRSRCLHPRQIPGAIHQVLIETSVRARR